MSKIHFTVKEFARNRRANIKTVYAWIARGKLDVVHEDGDGRGGIRIPARAKIKKHKMGRPKKKINKVVDK